MSRCRWPWISVLFIGLIGGGCAAQTGSTPGTPPPEKAVEIRSTVMAWLDCEECSDGELQAVVKLGDAAVPSLIASLRGGLSPARREQLRRHLEESYPRLQNKSQASADVYVQRYTENLVALHRMRAADALSIIGGPTARQALESAQTEPYRDDVKQSIKAALARLAKP
jgi:hypothetical protein